MPYYINSVVDAIQKRGKAGKRFTIIAVAEGAISKEDAALSMKELKEKKGEGEKKRGQREDGGVERGEKENKKKYKELIDKIDQYYDY